MLVRFLTGRDEQSRRCRRPAEPTTIPALYKDPDVLTANPYFSRILQVSEGLALRPSVQAGKIYPEVSRTYFDAVHAVLSRRQSAVEAASELQGQLVTILKSQTADVNTLRSQETATARR